MRSWHVVRVKSISDRSKRVPRRPLATNPVNDLLWDQTPPPKLHAQVRTRGKTTLTIQKARWASEWHKRRLDLVWTDGEGFEVAEAEEIGIELESVQVRPRLFDFDL